MESTNPGLQSLMNIIRSQEPTYTDPASGEQLHNSGTDYPKPHSPNLSGAVIIPFPVDRTR